MEANVIEVSNQLGSELGNDAEDEFVKRKKRKSNFFSRRSSLFVPDLMNDLKDRDTSAEVDSNSVLEEIKLMNEYITDLETEKRDWNNVYQDLKRKYRLVNSGPLTKTELLDEECCSQYLTDEDKKFLADQPDYQGVCKLMDQTIETLALTTSSLNRFKQLTNKFNEIVAERIKSFKIDCIKRLECENSSEKSNIDGVSIDSALGSSFIMNNSS